MKKIISAVLAAVMLLGMTTALAETKINRAILLCYDDNGALVYSKLLKPEDDSIPSQYDSTNKKVYYIVDTDEFKDGNEFLATWQAEATPAPTVALEATTAPEATVAPEVATTPTATPKASEEKNNSPYPKEADGIYAPAVVTEVGTSVNSKEEEVYSVTVLYQGAEITVGIPETLEIATAPEAHADIKGENALALEKGDVICMTANVAGNKIKRVDLIYRPVKEDIVTGGTDYGDNFEKLFTTGGSVAGQWAYMKYGEKPSKDKYQYAFGIVAGRSGNTITLLNTSGVTADEIDIDVSPNAYVYSTAVTGKEYDFDIEGVSGITSSLPKRLLSEDVAGLDDTYTYNYALVRLVEDTATDIVIYKDYND